MLNSEEGRAVYHEIEVFNTQQDNKHKSINLASKENPSIYKIEYG